MFIKELYFYTFGGSLSHLNDKSHKNQLFPSFIIFHEYSIINELNTIDNHKLLLNHIQKDTQLLYKWVQKNKRALEEMITASKKQKTE